ncbi:MAG: hydroxyacid dehydrogenase [Candidatus Marinimicrobia bacterium]|nr:hydroxyacid dehydrogenase [Candidatus Neomarinimicrobiota bacterium]
MKKVLLSKPIDPAGMKVLKDKVEPVILSNFNVETIKKMVADVEGIILRTNIKVTREIIESAPYLKIISRTGAGVDNIEVAAATEKGILVCNTPGVNSIPVAEQALALMLNVAKQLKTMDKAVHNANWKIRYTSKAVDIEGKTLGLVGMGHIGSLLAKKCRLAFNMKVIAYDPYVKQAEGVELCSSLDQLFSQSDFISIHVPYTEETHHLVDVRLLGLMKPDSCLINTSRGSIVDEKALIEALKNKSIAGAGLDVFEKEPPSPDNLLLKFDNVITTPHSSALSRECVMKVAMTAAQAIVDYLEGRQPKYIYNKNVLQLK